VKRSRGLTVIEIMVVIAIMAVIIGVAVAGTSFLPSARLRRSAAMITSAIKVAYTRATATSHDLRLVMDMDRQTIWLEESDVPMLVSSKDASGTGGAAAVTQAERAALAAGEKLVKGFEAPRPRFHAIRAYGFGDVDDTKGGGKALERGIRFRSVQVSHDDAAHESGRAYLYFWPGGRTERASIQLRIGDSDEESQTLTLLVKSPLTGKVLVKPGPVELELPADDSHASERQDNGF
jgi:general secretion pathway protein H